MREVNWRRDIVREELKVIANIWKKSPAVCPEVFLKGARPA